LGSLFPIQDGESGTMEWYQDGGDRHDSFTSASLSVGSGCSASGTNHHHHHSSDVPVPSSSTTFCSQPKKDLKELHYEKIEVGRFFSSFSLFSLAIVNI